MKNEDKMLRALAIPTIVLSIFVLMIPFALFNAWVALTLYNWFLVPLGLPAVNIWHMWGIMLLIGRFKGINTEDSKDSEISKAIGELAVVILGGLLALLIGLILKGLI